MDADGGKWPRNGCAQHYGVRTIRTDLQLTMAASEVAGVERIWGSVFSCRLVVVVVVVVGLSSRLGLS